MITPSQDVTVYKPNPIIEAHYPDALSSREADLLTVLLYGIQRDENGNVEQIVRLRIKDLIELYKLEDSHSAYESTYVVSKRLLSRVIEVKNKEDDTITQFQILSTVKYYKRQGYVDIKIHEELMPYLLDLKQYASHLLKYYTNLNSFYAKRIYELIIQYRGFKDKNNKWKREIKIVELRKKLGIEKKYKLYGHLKERILISSVNEINQYTDLIISCDEIKIGRRVESILFNIEEIEKNIIVPDNLLNYYSIKLIDKLNSYGIGNEKIEKYKMYEYTEEKINNQIILLEEGIKNNTIKEITPWLKNAIEKDYYSTSTKGIKNKLENKKNINNEEDEKLINNIKSLKNEYLIIINSKIKEYINNNTRKSILIDICNSHTSENSVAKKYCQEAIDNNDIDSMFDQKSKFLPFVRPYIETKIDIIEYKDFLLKNNIEVSEFFLKDNNLTV